MNHHSSNRRLKLSQLFFGVFLFLGMACLFGQAGLESFLSYPEPANLTGNKDKLAWTFNEEGKRNVYVAEAPDFKPRRLTPYLEDDGQEITQLSISKDGKWVVYVRGGDHGGNWSASQPVNPGSEVEEARVQVWSVPFTGGEPVLLAARGSYPVVSPNSDKVVFIKSDERWIVNIDGSGKAEKLFADNGNVRHLEWSPDGRKIVFTSHRESHSFIGVYELGKQSLQWISPGFSQDMYPRWSPDGNSVVFIRRPGNVKLKYSSWDWEIRVANLSGSGSKVIWKAPKNRKAGFVSSLGRSLQWAANDRIVFRSYHDGWQHLYAVPSNGGKELLLTPGDFMVEEISLNEKGDQLIFSANTGKTAGDIDRRHIGVVSVDKPDMELLTQGDGAETSPVFLENTVAFLSSTPGRPALPALLKDNDIVLIGAEYIPDNLPRDMMVTPEQVIFASKDGTKIHGQLFDNKKGGNKKPAIVFVHGGPNRQMMLAWDHRGYYAHTYALNQYLANQGYVVLSVNYRLGIGYGYDFDRPRKAGSYGASEYQDIQAAGEWLAKRKGIDPKRIGVYGGSYGGYLTALALGKNSDLFAAGVDIHGVHNRVPKSVYKTTPDTDLTDRVSWKSSPVAHVKTWTSPVLLIHADDDRNVGFGHSIDLAQRLEKKGVYFESLVIPDDTHHWMLHENLLKISKATVDFFDRQLKK
ncbi:S9 family peptidase [Sinomicrobium soli]|uniref:S9 family peptidase n=1 Tax=Sinomicrobium sp. N-1-3-6 TaxID=2219864 RepID=UPI000DCCC48C|nr:prolyl oligopeptidase family serine peptidase [Sinomicrobium sp. N-1-3-6]RAV29658.1 S9 family peptidase [Sinomicrobium sp. N-1-3-6]